MSRTGLKMTPPLQKLSMPAAGKKIGPMTLSTSKQKVTSLPRGATDSTAKSGK